MLFSVFRRFVPLTFSSYQVRLIEEFRRIGIDRMFDGMRVEHTRLLEPGKESVLSLLCRGRELSLFVFRTSISPCSIQYQQRIRSIHPNGAAFSQAFVDIRRFRRYIVPSRHVSPRRKITAKKNNASSSSLRDMATAFRFFPCLVIVTATA